MLQFLHLCLYPVSRIQGVGAGSQAEGHSADRFPLVACFDIVVLSADLRFCHIPQLHRRPIRVGAQHNGPELFRRLQQAAGVDGGIQLLPFAGRGAAELAGRNLGVLRLESRDHVIGGQVVVVQFGRVHPDPHGVLGTEDGYLTDPFRPADDVLDVGNQIVGQGMPIHGTVFRDNADDHQEVSGGFHHLNPLALNDLGEERRGELQFVLHLHLGHVRVGPRLEGQVDCYGPGRIAGGGHVDQVIDAVQLLFHHLGDRILHGLG